MIDQEHDWLDERLAQSSSQLPYIADDGFTQRVTDRLPQSASKNAGRVRRRILTLAIGSALALGIALAVHDLPALVQNLVPLADAAPITHAAGQLTALIRQPVILYGGAAIMTLSSFAVLPFLRRWV